ncbi:glycerol-3-phosphate dehydrogenase [Marinobacterium nitratireducens]|uniref:Glycerol-3-phosphate dehydrogenase n=1 Tax=Marinobacterium nitratireducens TaxID=518897 RepID=A0A917ZFQ3_9GAMM|nr:glycerol-3-phosphate dehydrogenase [Marinobacterium nitratireducens]GGO81259.1 glycerol-3-phosphate dehydrogenase [Marinobacterium nitratireducens]
MPAAADIQDLIVIGGGINGVGIALDAAGRGLSVLLCESGDLGGATSSRSSKLAHGGLRYLEQGAFRLVREALDEREILLRNAPHISHPLRFRLPLNPNLRPAWQVRAGLFLYDHLARRHSLPPSHAVRFGPDDPLSPDFVRGFEYSDGWIDDARLVVLVAMAARERSAEILPRTGCVAARREDGIWRLTLERSGRRFEHRARALVNATGPWASRLFADVLGRSAPQQLRLVKGSHIVVPRIYSGSEAYILQHQDGRIVFVIPYEERYSLIGTTDVDYHGDPAHAEISAAEIDYLLNVVNRHFRRQTQAEDLVWHYAGVRALASQGSGSAQRASRDYSLELDAPQGDAPLLSVFGGKLTTYRRLAETACNRLAPFFPAAGSAWTRDAPLPGGDMDDPATLAQSLLRDCRWLPPRLADRFAHSYGTLSWRILEGCNSIGDLGAHLGADLYAREAHYLVRHEWAQSTEDILWRRSKLGLRFAPADVARLESWLLDALAGET